MLYSRLNQFYKNVHPASVHVHCIQTLFVTCAQRLKKIHLLQVLVPSCGTSRVGYTLVCECVRMHLGFPAGVHLRRITRPPVQTGGTCCPRHSAITTTQACAHWGRAGCC